MYACMIHTCLCLCLYLILHLCMFVLLLGIICDHKLWFFRFLEIRCWNFSWVCFVFYFFPANLFLGISIDDRHGNFTHPLTYLYFYGVCVVISLRIVWLSLWKLFSLFGSKTCFYHLMYLKNTRKCLLDACLTCTKISFFFSSFNSCSEK